MWFDNPFKNSHADPDNLALLLRNLGAKDKAAVKRSSTVDVWRGNYEDFKEPKPRIAIMRRSDPGPRELLAEVKTLMPDTPNHPTTRTLLCHHATEDSGHTVCSLPGKCRVHSLQKPSAFEVSQLDRCRSVIDLYEQGVMSGVINSNQQITRNGATQEYTKVATEVPGNCITHPSTNNNQQMVLANPPRAKSPGYITVPKKSVSFSKDLIEEKVIDPSKDFTKDHNRPVDSGQVVADLKKEFQLMEREEGKNNVVVKCVNPHCGRMSVIGERCGDCSIPMPSPVMLVASKKEMEPEPEPIKKSERICDSQAMKSCSEPSLLPSCYYQHARSRMDRLKEKSRSLVEKTYAPPASLAKSNRELVKKYNAAKQNNLRRRKFVIPNVSLDNYYQNARPKKSSVTQGTPRRYSAEASLRQTYPRIRHPSPTHLSRSKNSRSVLDKRETIKVAMDKHGPLVFAVQNGKIHRMAISEVQSDHCRLDF